MQSLAEMLKASAPSASGEVFGVIARRYNLARGLVMVLFIAWSVYEYKTTKKKLGL